MATTETTRSAPISRLGGRWIQDWTPEDPDFWASTGRRIAARNLIFSIFAEHIGFAIWSLWSVMVLFMSPKYGISVADKFLLTSTPTLVGAVLRIPYNLAVAKFGGRNWTVISALLLLIPAALAAIVMQPGTSFGTFLLVAAVGGFGGGNFASSMTNINTFYPQSRKGWALGINAGGGNLGVAVIQLVGLLVLGTAGLLQPRIVLWVFLPLIVLAALGAVLYMDNLATARNDTKAMREVIRDGHAWVMSLLYIGTFGSFIGYAFAFGLVLQNQFHRTPIQAAGVTFLGPLLGSLSRPLGGWLSDRLGGARVTFWNFVLMAVCAGGTGAGRQQQVARPLHVRLHRVVRLLRYRQRLDLQDDPGHLPGQGTCRDRVRSGRNDGAAEGSQAVRCVDRHRGCDRRARWRRHQPGVPPVVRGGQVGHTRRRRFPGVLRGLFRRHLGGLPAEGAGTGGAGRRSHLTRSQPLTCGRSKP